jgi:hypothetical protein
MAMAGLVMGALLSGVASSAASATTVKADVSTPEVFAGSATATALKLSLLGLNLTVSKTDASADSSAKAHADATVIGGNLLTLSPTSADAPVGTTLTDTSPNCSLNVPLPAILSVTALCSQSAAAVPTAAAPALCGPGSTGIAPAACGNASVLDIEVQLLKLLQPVIDQLKALIAPVDQTVGQLLSNLPVVTPLLKSLLQTPVLSGLNLNLQSPLSSLLTAVENATELLSVKVLPSVSAISTTAGSFTAAAEGDGAVITLLPGLTIAGNPLLQISVAKAAAGAVYDRTACKSTPSATGSVLEVKVLDNPPITVGTGTLTLPLGLGAITLGGATTSHNPDGSVGAIANGIDINLLNGAIDLNIGHAEAVAGGACAVVVAATTTTTTTTVPVIVTSPPEHITLATTGTSAPILPIGVFLILAGFVTSRALRFRRSQKSTPR